MRVAGFVLVAVAVLGCQGSDKTGAPSTAPSPRQIAPSCGRADDLVSYRIKGSGLSGDVDGDGTADRVTLRADERRARPCRHLIVVEIQAGKAIVAVVKPLPWPGTDPELLLLAEIDGSTGLEPVVALSPAGVYQPGAVFAARDGELARMRLEGVRPGDLFPLADEFPAGVDCAGRRGTIVATFGELSEQGHDDRHWDVRRSFYRAAGIRFALLRTERFRVEVGPEAKRRWRELGGDPFLICPDRVR